MIVPVLIIVFVLSAASGFEKINYFKASLMRASIGASNLKSTTAPLLAQ
jgi:hypothetical protein